MFPLSKASNTAFRVRLIDIGETVPLTPNACKYNLISDAKKHPPMAILCRIEKVRQFFFSFVSKNADE